MFDNYNITTFNKMIKALNLEQTNAFVKFKKTQADNCNYHCIQKNNAINLQKFQTCFDTCINFTLNRAPLLHNKMHQIDLIVNNPEQYQINLNEQMSLENEREVIKQELNKKSGELFPDYMYSTNDNIKIQDAQKYDNLKQVEKNRNSAGFSKNNNRN